MQTVRVGRGGGGGGCGKCRRGKAGLVAGRLHSSCVVRYGPRDAMAWGAGRGTAASTTGFLQHLEIFATPMVFSVAHTATRAGHFNTPSCASWADVFMCSHGARLCQRCLYASSRLQGEQVQVLVVCYCKRSMDYIHEHMRLKNMNQVQVCACSA